MKLKELSMIFGALCMIGTGVASIIIYIYTRDPYLSIIIYLGLAVLIGSLCTLLFSESAWNSFLMTAFFFLFVLLPVLILQLVIFIFSHIMGLFTSQIHGMDIMDTLIPGILLLEIIIAIALLPLGIPIKLIEVLGSTSKTEKLIE